MSRACIDVLKENFITENEFTDVLKVLGVDLLDSSVEHIGVVQMNDSAIWIHYDIDEAELRDFIDDLEKDFNFKPSVNIWIELNSYEDSSKLALDFCRKLSKKYSDFIINDGQGNYIRACDLDKLIVVDNWKWVFKD